MSAGRAVVTEIDLEEGSAKIESEFSIEDLFEGDEWRLLEYDDGWVGFQREERDGFYAYFYRDTRHDDWTSRIRVGERAILVTAQKLIVDLDLFAHIRSVSA